MENHKLDVNSALVDDFMKVRGVGRRTAGSIVNFRNRKGPFRSIDDLLRVDGVSGVLKDRIGELMRVYDPLQ